MRGSLMLDQVHNNAIRAELGDRLAIILSGEQPKLPPRVQRLLDRLSRLDDETEIQNSPSIVPSVVPPKMKAFDRWRR